MPHDSSSSRLHSSRGRVALSQAYRGLLAENILLRKYFTSLLDQIFDVIEHIDQEDYLTKNDLVTFEYLKPISTPELFGFMKASRKTRHGFLEL